MPIIPYRPDLGAQQDTNFAKPSEGAYTQQADNFQKIGQNVMVAGATIDRVNQKYEEQKDSIARSNATSDAKMNANMNLGRAVKDAEGDPEKLFPLLQKYNQESKSNFSKQFKDDEYLKARVESEYDSASANIYDNALAYKSLMQKQDMSVGMLGSLNAKQAAARTSPYEVQTHYDDGVKLIQESQMLAPQKADAQQKFRKSMATEAVNGYLDGASDDGYMRAKDIVNNKFADAFDSQERDSILQKIDAAKVRRDELGLKDDNFLKKKLFEQQDLAQAKTTRDVFKSIEESKKPGNVDGSHSIANLTRLVDESDMKPAFKVMAKKMLNGEEASDNPVREGEFWQRLVQRDDLGELRDAVANSAANGEIPITRATTLFNEIDKIQLEEGPHKVVKSTDPRVRAALKEISNRYGSDMESRVMGKSQSPANARLERDVTIQFHENLSDPRFGGDIQKAEDAALAKFDHAFKLPKSFKLLKTNTTQEQINEVHTLVKKGSMSHEVGIELLRSLAIQVDKESSLRSRKDGTGKSK